MRFTREAFRQASALGSRALVPEHFILAVTETPSRAARALAQCGVTHDALADAVAAMDHDMGFPERVYLTDEPQLNPASYEFIGRAAGLAAGLGAGGVDEEHLLLAFLWEPYVPSVLSTLGTTRDAVLEQLRALGVSVPVVPLPNAYESAIGSPVYVTHTELERLLERLPVLLPDGAKLAFNHDGEGARAWIATTEGIDLGTLIEQIRREP